MTQNTLRKIILAAALAAVTALGACGKKGDEFVGTWKEDASPDRTWHIVRGANDTFEVTKGDDKDITYPAHLKDGSLQVLTALGKMDMAYNKESDKISMPDFGPDGTMSREK